MTTHTPVTIVHSGPSVEAGIGFRGWATAVVIVPPWWPIVVISRDCSCWVVHVPWLPVHTVYRGIITTHTSDRTSSIQRECVRDRGDNCASGCGLSDFLDLKKNYNPRQNYGVQQ